MKVKKTCFSTSLVDLYGRDNTASHVTVGRRFWWQWPSDSEIYRLTHKNWNLIEITYVRSGAAFYVLPDNPEVPEKYFALESFLGETLIYAELDPIKDLKFVSDDIEKAKKYFCFNSEHTIVKNWDNSREIDIPEDEVDFFDINSMLI